MRPKKQSIYVMIVCLLLLILIFDSGSAMLGAREGIDLCISTVIPSLFPFVVISILLNGLLSNQSFRLLHPLGRLMHLPSYSEGLLLIGLLGGYPVGAHNVVEAYKNGRLTKEQAERMLSFCNNAGPAFIFGIGASIFSEIWPCVLVWIIQIFSAVLTGCLSCSTNDASKFHQQFTPVSLTDAVHRSIRVIASISGWIVLFRVIIAYLQRWVFCSFNTNVQILICSLLELSNGSLSLNAVSPIAHRFTPFCLMLCFGGLCITMQTKSLLVGTDLSFRAYLPGKMAQTSICYLFCAMITPLISSEEKKFPNPLLLIASILCCVNYRNITKKSKMNIAFPFQFMYNKFQRNQGGRTYEPISQEG